MINDRWPIALLDHRRQFHVERPGWEAERLAAMFDRVEPGQTVVDVGAEEGDLSALYQSWVGEVGQTILVEPQAAYWPAIRATYELNRFGPPAVAFAGFADDVEGALDDAPSGVWPRAADGPIAPDAGFRHVVENDGTIPVLPLDEIVGVHRPDHVVLDVEGAEYRVLCSARRIIVENRPTFWVSVHQDQVWMDAHYRGEGIEAIDRLLTGYGYVGTRLVAAHEDHWLYEPAP